MEEQKRVELSPEVIEALKDILGRLNEILDELPPQAKAAAGILAAILGYPKVREALTEEDARDLHDVLYDLQNELQRRTQRVNIIPLLQRAIEIIRNVLQRLRIYPYYKPYYGYRYRGFRYYYPYYLPYKYAYPYYRYPYYRYPGPTPYRMPRLRAAAQLVEAVEGSEGREWEARLIKPGLSENRLFYPKEVLEEAREKFEGVKVFIDHPTREERKSLPEGSVRDIAGWIQDVRMEEDGLYGRLMISEGQPWLMDMLRDAYERDKPDLVGLSILGDGKLRWEQKDGQSYWLVESINHIQRVDLVTAPAAGGNIVELIESRQRMEVEEEMSAKEELEVREEPFAAPVEPEVRREEFEALQQELRISKCHALLAESLSSCDLPQRAKDKLKKEFENRVFEEGELREAIQREKNYLAELASEIGPGFGSIRVQESEPERYIKALEGMLIGEKIGDVKPFRSLYEAYSIITGTPVLDIMPEKLLAESRGFDSALIRETVTTATWSNILGIAMTRAMLKFYRQPELDEWRLIVSAISPLRDFRTQERVRMPAVEGLPEVPEGGPFQEIPAKADEKVTYAVKTYGFLFPLTRQVIINDDLGAIRQIPRILGRSAKVELYKHVFKDLIEANPVVYDGKNLFHADHKNDLGTGKALSDATLTEAKAKMRAQVAYGTTADFLALKPAFLLCDPSIEAVARKLEQGEYAYRVAVDTVGVATSEVNIHRGTFRTIVVDHFDPAKAGVWYLVADPAAINTIEMGFLRGREEPELFVQEAPEVGSVFTADKITYKLRFDFQGVILDWRAFLRANA